MAKKAKKDEGTVAQTKKMRADRKALKAKRKAAAKAKKKAPAKKKEASALPQKARCYYHTLTRMVNFTKSGGALFAGSLHSLERSVQHRVIVPELIIELSGMSTDFAVDPVVTGNERAREDLPASLFSADDDTRPPAVLYIDWSDGASPDLDRGFWDDLAKYLLTVEGSVAVCCQGGHGRTGTALAILMALFKVTGPDAEIPSDPIGYVRERYCEQAVETAAQVYYVEDILGIRSTVDPSDIKDGWWGDHANKGSRAVVTHEASKEVTKALNGAGAHRAGETVESVWNSQTGRWQTPTQSDADFAKDMEARHADPDRYLIKGA